jgi:hypothetical protein
MDTNTMFGGVLVAQHFADQYKLQIVSINTARQTVRFALDVFSGSIANMSQSTNTAKAAVWVTCLAAAAVAVVVIQDREGRPTWKESAAKIRDLTPAERLMSLYDTDGDLKLSVIELSNHIDKDLKFAAIDQDGDGQVDSREFTVLLWRESPMRPHRKGRVPMKLIPRWEDWEDHAKRVGVEHVEQ